MAENLCDHDAIAAEKNSLMQILDESSMRE